jgi:hypothetical protein
MTTITGFDVTAANYALRPPYGQICLYITGSKSVAATLGMLAANPDAVRIDQSQVITAVDTTADVFDVENSAITTAELGTVIKDAWNNYNHAVRPGQRKPLVYTSADNVTVVANALVAAGLENSGTGLFVAHYGVTLPEAAAQVGAASGPFPIQAFQYQDTPNYDLDVFSAGWLSGVSGGSKRPTSILIDGKRVGEPTSAGVPVIVSWYGDTGATTRQGVIPLSAWDIIKWS